MAMDAATRAAVRERAGQCCEYCQRRQIDSPLIPLQIEHIVPRKHGGSDELENLALACADCNLRKGSNLTGIDPETNEIEPLYHPRRELWAAHFRWDGIRIVGLTPAGRTTIRVLELNSSERRRVRLASRKN
jgi:5-methylcytosine-specific restriction endonuclease McrA